MELINPFEEQVILGKAYPRDPTFGSDVRVLRALTPTGRHVGDALALHHTHNPHGGGGPATKLERYRGKKSRVGKASGGVKRSLELIAQTPKPTKVAAQSFAAATPKATGRSATRGKLAMENLRSKFDASGTVGKRL